MWDVRSKGRQGHNIVTDPYQCTTRHSDTALNFACDVRWSREGGGKYNNNSKLRFREIFLTKCLWWRWWERHIKLHVVTTGNTITSPQDVLNAGMRAILTKRRQPQYYDCANQIDPQYGCNVTCKYCSLIVTVPYSCVGFEAIFI